MKQVLVLGAGGVLGSEITRQLEQYAEVEQTCYDIRRIAYHRANGRNVWAHVETVCCDVPRIHRGSRLYCRMRESLYNDSNGGSDRIG